MATGDDALLGGMTLVNGATAGSAAQIDDYINRACDYIANGPTYWKPGVVLSIADGGTGATSPSGGRTALGLTSADVIGGVVNDGAGVLRIGAIGGNRIRVENTGYVTNNTIAYLSDIGSIGPDLTLSGHLYVPNSSVATSGWTAAYINADGRLSRGASSRRYKKDIAAMSIDKQAVLALAVVSFHHKAFLFDADDPMRSNPPLEVGLIAEDLHDAGLGWLVGYDAEGRPDSIRYDRIALALLPVIQDHEARLTALESAL